MITISMSAEYIDAENANHNTMRKKTTKWITEKQVIAMYEKHGQAINKEALQKMPHGEIVFARKHEETKDLIIYRLKRRPISPSDTKEWFKQEFDLNYSATQGRKSGKELIISSIELPDIKKFLSLSSKEQNKLIGLKGQKSIPGIRGA